jgi:murein L,D-transpeptidase YcbB/YkuD
VFSAKVDACAPSSSRPVRGNLCAFSASLAFAAILLASCAGTKPTPSTAVIEQDTGGATRAALKEILDPTRAPRQVLAFYSKRDFQPAWTETSDQQEMASEVRAILAHAHDQGLRDSEYAIARDPGARGKQAAQFEIVLTGAVLRYARDVHTGRLPPGSVFEDVELPAKNFDAVSELNEALEQHSLDAFFAGLPPHHPEYRRLVGALARYRAIADAGGWPDLADPKEISLNGKDPRREALIKRLGAEDPIFAAVANPSANDLRDAIKRYQGLNGLAQDGRVRGETLASLNVSATARVAQIAANLERWRWLPQQFEDRYVAVNAPDQSVQFVRDGAAILTSRVIIGRKGSPTPITRTEIVAAVVNPPWNIPGDIAARDLLPQLKRNPNYLATKHMVVTDGPPNDPYGRKIDWRKVVAADFPYAIQQKPGPETALGAVMLDSPNDFDVYLHDTPNKKRFEETDREISNGCVRVQQIFPLASLALTDDPMAGLATLTKAVKTHDTQRLKLDKPLPVYFLYWTAIPNSDGSVAFRPDRYGRDATLIAALSKGQAAAKPIPAEKMNMPADEVSP